MPNRLAVSASPYLRQHQDNPVDWYPWGEEAFAKAKAENKPIFLSVGYSSCHWCHVMAHESFESESVAAILNRNFVSIKVDREERPDVDEAYMTAVQLMSGRGGWPMSVFMTPDRKPFFAGTYFPPTDRGQIPGFATICQALARTWATDRKKIDDAATEMSGALEQTLGREAPGTFATLDPAFVEKSLRTLLADFDPEHAGFGEAPKFPPHTAIELLMTAAQIPGLPAEVREGALGASIATLEAMALGGIRDHVGGGFHRYSTDREWLLPHFEKMLYDNALLLANYARAADIAQVLEPRLGQLFLEAGHGIVEWLRKEMTAPDGTFYSALDADSEGEEGKFYVWTIAEVRAILGDRTDRFVEVFGFAPNGNFADEATGERTGANIPHLEDFFPGEFDEDLAKLAAARELRERPGLDDKRLVGWNGLMIGALAEAGVLDAAERAAHSILQAEEAHGELPHLIVDSGPSGIAFLEDYAYLADGLIRLAAARAFYEDNREAIEATGLKLNVGEAAFDAATHARRLVSAMVDRFYDEDRGGFYGTSDRHEFLFGRTKPAFDQPMPSSNSVALRCLLAVGDLARALKTASNLLGWIERAPGATEALLLACLPLAYAASFAEAGAEDGSGAAAAAPQTGDKPAAPVTTEPPKVRATLSRQEIPADAKGVVLAEVVLDVPEGLHLNSSDPPARWLVPTQLKVDGVAAEIDYPPAPNDRYEGTVRIPFRFTLPAGAAAAEFEVTVGWQACTETECFAAEEKRFAGVGLRA